MPLWQIARSGLADYVAAIVIYAFRQMVHDLFALLRIRLWRTGPVCLCTH